MSGQYVYTICPEFGHVWFKSGNEYPCLERKVKILTGLGILHLLSALSSCKNYQAFFFFLDNI